jgi:hypothetical protein
MYAATLSLEVQGTIAEAVEGALSVEVGGGIPKVSARLDRTPEDLRVHLMAEETMAAEVAQGAEDPLDEINVNPLTEGS